MARVGVQFTDIEKAAWELQGTGKIPTVDGVRDILGTGSRSTIAQHLRAWKAKQTEVAGSLPFELANLVTGLWKKLHTDADKRVDEAEATSRQQIEAVNHTIQQLQQEQTRLKNALHKSEETVAEERTTKKNRETQFQEKQHEQIKLNEQILAMREQHESSKAENARLHQLATHIQTNLEHYQEKMHQHQMNQTLMTEKQQTFYHQEIHQLKQQLVYEQNQIKPLEEAQAQLQNALEQRENQHQQLQDKYENLKQQHQDLIREKSAQIERHTQANQTIDSLQQKANETTTQLLKQENRMAVLLDQNTRLKEELIHAQDKVGTLRQKNLFLIQEKSQLEGFLNKVKHLEKPHC